MGNVSVRNAPKSGGAEMPPDTPEVNAGNVAETPKSGGKVRLLSLDNLDRRNLAYRNVIALIDRIERDLGGLQRLSNLQQSLVRQAALIDAMLEDQGSRWLAGEQIDPVAFCTLLNTARRSFEAVGLQRVPREVDTLSSYVAAKSVPPQPRP
jgi:hypothetical protein